MTHEEVLNILRKTIAEGYGAQTAFAKKHGISTAYLNDMLNGRRNLQRQVLEVLGIERVISYERIARTCKKGNDGEVLVLSEREGFSDWKPRNPGVRSLENSHPHKLKP